tara:strand:- start:500 stop:886 length:387 start_codon:yes stop_codon:yes gene_type:complete
MLKKDKGARLHSAPKSSPSRTLTSKSKDTKPVVKRQRKKYERLYAVYEAGQVRKILVGGKRNNQALLALIYAEERGVTAAGVSTWALRLAAYVHNLRQDYGVEIQTLKEPHQDGWHGRYVLHSVVEPL